MTATAAMIAQVRRMVWEPTTNTYDDAAIQAAIEAYPLMDERGEAPYTWDETTPPPTKTANANWVATYDLHAAAADLWEEKAAVFAAQHDFSADGGNYSRSQVYQQMMAQVRHHRARRAAKTMTGVMWPRENSKTPWIGNLPEED
jgi:hypothetical protein